MSQKCSISLQLLWEGLTDTTGIRRFLDAIRAMGLGASGVLGKLNNIELGLRYVETRLSLDPELHSIAVTSINSVRAAMQVSC